MKKRIYIFGLLLACFAPCSRILAQSNDYRNVEIKHKVGQFYTSDYRKNNERVEQADPYSNDTFDETSDGWTTPKVGNYGSIQQTHEYRTVIYMHPGKTRTLTLPGNMENTHLSMYNYQRWYDYSTDKRSTAITPAVNANLSYNFANGLVGGNFMERGIDNYDRALTKVSFTMPNVSVYYLACDVSNYTDVQRPNDRRGSITEPTLSQRVIFEIHDADEMINRLSRCTENTYLETYDYHLPAKRISNNTPEQVALELEAQNYFCPGETGNNAGKLTYEIVGGGDYITGRGEISGATRVIPFTLNNANLPANADDRKVQIRVYKTVNNVRYNIALFNLTFDVNTEGLSQTELAKISSTNKLYHRTNEYLDANYELVTRLDMDYENIVYGGYGGAQATYHPYPMNWTYSTYGAFVNQNNKSSVPQWGEYAITKAFPWGNTYDRPLNADASGTEIGYHLYVDANELPGTICELPFRENLCAGARLYVTAYVKSLGNASSNQCDANLLFIVKGIDSDGNETILYTQASGQIPRNGSSGNPEWFQIYFSYANGNQVYDRYVLQLENNCANTRGADLCLDDIRVYMNPLQIEAGITEPICAEEDNATVQLRLNYEMLTNRLAMTQGSGETRTGYYSFLNKRIYDQTFSNNNDNYEAAFEAALVRGTGVYVNSSSQYYGQFTFNSTFTANDGAGVGHEGEGENRVITFESSIATNAETTNSLVPGETYYIVYNASTFNPADVTDIRSLAEIYDFSSICTVKGEFLVEGNVIVRVNGDVQADAETSCVGQIPLITVQMRDGLDGVVEGAVFDWYFGSIDEFNQERATTGIDLFTALENFRHFYPNAHSITENIVPMPTEETWTLTQEEIDLIKSLNEDYGSGGSNPKLSLSASSNLTIRLMQAETPVVLIPIGAKPSEDIKVCWEPTQMILYAQDTAPSLSVGRIDVNYPEGAYPQGEGVSVRMDLAQYKDLTDNKESLTIPVRDPKLGDEDATVTQVDSDLDIYLIGTNDAEYISKVGSGFDYVVGQVEDFRIYQRMGAFSSGVKLKFDAAKLNMKEGYEYDVTFRFKTAGSSEITEDEADLLCFGNLVVPFKIVPAYQVWIGGKDGNWNNDENWRRADYGELNKTAQNYVSNAANKTDKGYAPMMSTRIVIPTPDKADAGSGQIELYAPTFTDVYELTSNKPEHIGDATHLIEYDVVVRPRGNAQGITTPYFAGRYYSNQCDEIHFDVGAEMLHSEYLTHNRAWTDVKIPTKQWTLVSTPLNGLYSGDWYTKTEGYETSEYFTDLTFDNGGYNRLKPLMTQRSWDGEAKVVSGSNDASAVVSNVTWSSTFNDVAVPYSPGKGFSIHANMGSSYSGDVMFRMPKSDESYDGFDDLSRDVANFGKLATSDMAELAEGTDYTVNIKPSQDGNYIIIGNPFVSHLSAKAFFDANGDVLESKYWTANGDYPKAGVADKSGNWQTTDGTGEALIAPYTAFYAQLKNNSTSEQQITFNTDMAALPSTTEDTPSTNGLVISAAGANGKSSTLLSYKATAVNGFADNEDVQLLNEASSSVPMVYTVAGDMATSINRIKDLQQIPLGLFAADGDVTTLTFTGVAALMEPSLYDAEMNTDTPLTEGYTLTVNGASHGRYFIRAKGAGSGNDGATGIIDVEAGTGGVSVYSVVPSQVVVSSDAGLLDVSVYSVGGAMLGHESVDGGRTAVTLDGIDCGVAVVKVVTADGQTTRKIVVK